MFRVKGIVPKYIHSEVKTIGESSSASATSIAASNASAGVPQVCRIKIERSEFCHIMLALLY